MNWFTTGTTSAGTGVKTLLDSVLTPVTASATNLLGTSTTQETVTPNTSSAKTGTIIVAALAIITLIVVGILIFKKSKN